MHFLRLPSFASWLCAGLQFAVAPASAAQAPSMQRAVGRFDVTLTPAGTPVQEGGATTARMLLVKQYHGPLAASGQGEMLSAISTSPGSAGYVAIERIDGTLNGRQGSFVVQHSGTRKGGVDRLLIVIVPDSGSGQLKGISGTLALDVADGQHHYVLEYALP